MDLAFSIMSLAFQYLTKYPLQCSVETSIVSLENVYYVVYIFVPIITGLSFIISKHWITSYKVNYLYLNFEEKVNIVTNIYIQIYLISIYVSIILLYVYYLFMNWQYRDKILSNINYSSLIVLLTTCIIFTNILMMIYRDIEIKNLLIIVGNNAKHIDNNLNKIEKKFKNVSQLYISWSAQIIILFFPFIIKSYFNWSDLYPIVQIGLSLIIFIYSFNAFVNDITSISEDKIIDYKNCDDIRIYLKNRIEPLKFKEDLKEGNFIMVISEDKHIRISDKKITRIQDIAPERIDEIEFLYLDEQLNIILEYSEKEWLKLKYDNKQRK